MSEHGGHGERMSREMEQAIACLLGSKSIRSAARKAGVADRTLRTWLAEPSFANAYRVAREQVLEHALASLNQQMGTAIAVLRKAMRGKDTKAAIRAASVVLSAAVRGAEKFETHRKIQALEDYMNELMSRGNGPPSDPPAPPQLESKP